MGKKRRYDGTINLRVICIEVRAEIINRWNLKKRLASIHTVSSALVFISIFQMKAAWNN